MKVYGSYQNMFQVLEQDGWSTEPHPYGTTYRLDPRLGDGTMMLWGDSSSLGFVMLDITYKEDTILVNFNDGLGIQITFIEENDMEYYQSSSNIERTHYGTYFYINNAPIPWFKKYPKDNRIRALTLLLNDEFLKENGINLTLAQWNDMARAINCRDTSIPQISAILTQIKNADFDNDLFQLYLKSKAIEAFLLLWNYSRSQERVLRRINAKSQNAVKQTLHLLTKDFLSPPIITDIAKMVDVDKKTLQFAFKEIVGLSIHKYIRSLRMQQAIRLLESTDMPIESISKSVGYNSKIHFYRAFDEVFSMKPTEMRRLL